MDTIIMKTRIWPVLLISLILLLACQPTIQPGQPGQPGQPATEPAIKPTLEPAVEPTTAPQAAEPITIIIGPERVACAGVEGQTCLQVKFDSQTDWEPLPDGIAGFDYRPGFEYTLLVKDLAGQDPPAGVVSTRYQLLALISQTAAEKTKGMTMIDQLIGRDWDLTSLAGQAPLPDKLVTISFSETEVTGSAGCNSYFGSYTLTGSQLSIGQLGSTMMFCEEGMEQEQQFLAMLGTAEKIALEQATLTIHTAQGTLVFQTASQATLTGQQWILSGLAQGQTVTENRLDAEITAEFAAGRISGSAGCNRYFANYEADEATLTLGSIGSTRMSCDEVRNQREAEFLTALASVTGYRIQRNSLILLDAQGNVLLSFRA